MGEGSAQVGQLVSAREPRSGERNGVRRVGCFCLVWEVQAHQRFRLGVGLNQRHPSMVHAHKKVTVCAVGNGKNICRGSTVHQYHVNGIFGVVRVTQPNDVRRVQVVAGRHGVRDVYYRHGKPQLDHLPPHRSAQGGTVWVLGSKIRGEGYHGDAVLLRQQRYRFPLD